MARYPSSLGSNIQPGWENEPSISRACIGFSAAGNGAGLPCGGPAGAGSRPCFRSSIGQPRVDGAVLGQDVALRVRVLVTVLDEEPVTGPATGTHKGPRAAHLPPLQGEGELAGLQLLTHPAVGLVAVTERQDSLLVGRVDSRVPYDHLARAVAAARGLCPRSPRSPAGGPRPWRRSASRAGRGTAPLGVGHDLSTPSISSRTS